MHRRRSFQNYRNATFWPISLHRLTGFAVEASLETTFHTVSLRLSEKSRRAPSQSSTSPKTGRNSPDFAVVCQPNVGSRHHSAPFRTVSEGVFCEVGLRHNAVLRSSTLLAAFYTMSATAWVGSGGEGGQKRICRPNRTKLLCFASMKKSGTRAT